jgi:hypothetical protein
MPAVFSCGFCCSDLAPVPPAHRQVHFRRAAFRTRCLDADAGGAGGAAAAAGAARGKARGGVQRDWAGKCGEVLSAVLGDTRARWFDMPVDAEELGIPDYPEIVKEPMDLGTVKVGNRLGV